MGMVKVLFLASNPMDSTRLALDKEVRQIEVLLRSSKYRDSIALKSWWAVQPDDLLQALNEELPQIVHFSGHGHPGSGLVFHANDGTALALSGKALATVFAALKGNVRVVVLNACYSQQQAAALAAHIDCIVGMTDAISDDAATLFSASFYRAIAFGHSIRNAFDQGLASIALEAPGHEHLPTLITRDRVDPRRVVLIQDRGIHLHASPPVPTELHLGAIKHDIPNKLMQKHAGDSFLRHNLPALAGKIRHREALSLAIIDIDELTLINKRFGRRVGNTVIGEVARVIHVETGALHSGRCGDDTYYLVLPGFDVSDAERIATQLSRCIVHHPWQTIAPELRVTCSFGVSELQAREPTVDWVVRAAVALKTAKSQVVYGRCDEAVHGKIGKIEMDKIRRQEEALRQLEWEKHAAERRRVAVAPRYLSKSDSREFRDYWS